MEQGQDPVIRRFRDQISATDREILDALNRRIALVSELHAYKTEKGYPPGDPAREAALIDSLERLNPGPLSTAGLRTVYEAIVGEWKRQPPPARAGEAIA